MRNMKVSMKLILCFLIVVALAVVVGVVGIVGMRSINAADDALYNGNYLPTIMASEISQNIVEQRVIIRNYVIYDVNNDAQLFSSAQATMAELEKTLDALLAEYKGTIVNPEDQAAYDEFVKVYYDEWTPLTDEIYLLGSQNRVEEAKVTLTEAATAAAKMNELSKRLVDINASDGAAAVNNNTSLFNRLTLIEVLVLVASAATAMVLAFYISGMISKPLNVLTSFMNKAGTTGDIILTKAEEDDIRKYSQYEDETGQCLSSTSSFIEHITVISQELEAVAGGNLGIDVRLLSERDTMGLSMKKMTDNLNNMFSEINSSTAQVSTGSKQIADGAQSLAQGSTQQAAAVQQLSSSIAEIAEKTKANAEMAIRAANLANTIKGNAEKGSMQMDQMMSAVKEINDASQSISKVIKTIDDIAFQTNILALNAAVEAARAGQHGKGFAVVAEEVRNLAAKSAEAAKDTSGLIANSMEKAELGARIADDTSASLVEIVSGINESSQIVGDIATSSEEQSEGISQINKGIDQVAQVVQQNSATAEQSAAASQEMSGQATMLEQLISQFKLRDSGSRSWELPSAPADVPMRSPEPIQSSYSGEYGKY